MNVGVICIDPYLCCQVADNMNMLGNFKIRAPSLLRLHTVDMHCFLAYNTSQTILPGSTSLL